MGYIHRREKIQNEEYWLSVDKVYKMRLNLKNEEIIKQSPDHNHALRINTIEVKKNRWKYLSFNDNGVSNERIIYTPYI